MSTKLLFSNVPARAPAGRRACLMALGGGFAAASCASLGISPRPTAALIRLGFDHNGEATAKALAKYVPPGVNAVLDEPYDPDDEDARLDVFTPARLATAWRALPTIVWVHGGAWVSGDKSQIANYLRILASHGYTAVGVNYAIAPRKTYPTPLRQIGAARRHDIARHRKIVRGMVTGALLIAGFFTFPFHRLLGQWLLG